MTRYQEALTWLYGLESRGIKLGLERMQEALAHRGNPHAGLRFLHVAGTNGKGSVTAMVAAGLGALNFLMAVFWLPESRPRARREAERAQAAEGGGSRPQRRSLLALLGGEHRGAGHGRGQRLGAAHERDGVLLGIPCQIWRHPSAQEAT